jgi:ribonuclease HII
VALGDDGEIDHILPRSYTLEHYGTVFNSEGNLIYVHQKCNQSKADSIYKLPDIKAGISAEWIEEQVATIKNFKTFSVLSAEQQKAFRYALFLPSDNEAYKKVIDWLRTDQSTMVNGTQKYLAKKIQEKLTKMLPNKELSFEFILVDAEEVSRLRQQYAKQNQLLQKQEKQAPSSHTIDAVMAFVCRYQKIFKDDTPPNADKVVKLAMLDSWSAVSNEHLTKGLSTNQKIEKMIQSGDYGQKNMREVFGKSIFKDEAIGERYRPIVVYGNKIYVGYPKKISGGYDLQDCYEVNKKDREQIKSILASNYVKLSKDEYGVKLYEINKRAVSEASNEFFGSAYSSLDESQKAQAALVEAVINNCKYYVKKTEVVNAPQIIAKADIAAYPFYADWVRFDSAWKQEIGDRYKEKTEQGKKIYDISQLSKEWVDFCKKYFGIKKTDIRYKARKTFSIMALATPPGTVFRLKRKMHKKDSFVYQAVAIDNQQVSGDYASVLLKNGKETMTFAGQKPSQNLKKELIVKETKEIRGEKIEPSKLFVDDFDTQGVQVVLNNTNAVVKNFPLEFFKNNIVSDIDELTKQKRTSLPLKTKGNQNELCAKKDAMDAILKLAARDGSVSSISIREDENLVDFVLPFKSTQKLLSD